MKKFELFLLITIFFSPVVVKGQENNYWNVDTTDHFNDPHCPFTNPLTMWLLKQNLTLKVFQSTLSTDFPMNKLSDYSKSRIRFETYLPLINMGSFFSMLGTSYSKSFIMAKQDSLDTPLQNVCLFWLPMQYEHAQWKFTFIYENFIRGDDISLFESPGNAQRFYFMIAYAFNKEWQIIAIGGHIQNNMENSKEIMTIPALQGRYVPHDKFRIVFGLPVLCGFDYTFFSDFDLSFSQIMTDDTEAFLRYNFTKEIGMSFHFQSTNNNSSETYFFGKQFLLNSSLTTYNNLTQKQNSVSLKLGIKTLNNIGVFVSCGYNMSSTVKLYHNKNLLGKVPGRDDFFIGLNIQLLKYY